MENKFTMTVEDNIFWAKRNIVDTIYKNAKLEGINVTFPDTQAIIEGGIINDLKSEDVDKVLAMKHAWEFIVDTVDYPLSYAYLCELHKLCAPDVPSSLRGKLRNVPVQIGGTEWQPTFPIESAIKEELSDCLAIENPTDRALTTMLWVMRRQMFLDGNKRTAMLMGNRILIENGCGIVALKESDLPEFGMKLIHFYETGDMEDVKKFVYENAITGFDSDKAIQKSETIDEKVSAAVKKMNRQETKKSDHEDNCL